MLEKENSFCTKHMPRFEHFAEFFNGLTKGFDWSVNSLFTKKLHAIKDLGLHHHVQQIGHAMSSVVA